eukprot:360262-Chlamydomonas_euryale.AAC.2
MRSGTGAVGQLGICAVVHICGRAWIWSCTCAVGREHGQAVGHMRGQAHARSGRGMVRQSGTGAVVHRRGRAQA